MRHVLLGFVALLALLATGPARADVDKDRAGNNKSGPLHFNVDEFIKDHDANKDGSLQRDELPEALRPQFDRLDANKDGKISRAELEKGVVHLQARRRPSDVIYILIETSDCDEGCTDEVQRAYDILRKLDKDRNGKIDAVELKAMREQLVRDRVERLFRDLDRNRDGRISKDEAKGELRRNFDRVDTNGDGFIERDELLKAASERSASPSTSGKGNRRDER